MVDNQLNDAAVLFNHGDYAGAESIYRALHRQAGTRSESSYGLGLIALRQAKPDQAAVWFSMIASDEARHTDACYYLATIARDAGDVPRARALCAQVLRASPDHRAASLLADQLNHAMPVPRSPAAPRGSAPAPSNAAHSELYLPSGDDEAASYAADLLRKKQATYWTGWRARPAWVRKVMVAAYIVFAAVFLTIVGIIVDSSLHHSSTNNPGQAGQTRSWCQGVYDQYPHNAPLPAAAKDALQANDCQKYGIPPGS